MHKKPFERCIRVGAEIQKVISDLIRKNISDPRLQNVTVTGVKMSRDLRVAKIYFTTYQSKNKLIKINEAFLSAKNYVKREVARQMNLRYMPDIMFFYDKSFDYGAHMNKVFKTINDLSVK